MTDTTTALSSGALSSRRAGGRSFATLVRAEARKLFDTRTGMILTAILVVFGPGSVVARGFVAGPHFFTLAGTAGIVLGILLPVLAILTVTGEWSHRTALTTFVLEPRRGRVLAAKFLPPLAVAVLAGALALLLALPVTAAVAAVRGVPADWDVAPGTVLGWVAVLVICTAQGQALGMLLLNAPAAIVIYLASPMAWSAVRGLGGAGKELAGWLDLNTTTNLLTGGGMTGGGAARLAVSVLVWIAVPVTVGALRVCRKDIN
ncbi:ABC transporter permease subunit [Nonomuraea phyllanthi]|uniref:ABC transporter permease subunit n=1 Tax=Nonomuraea phyllanthi TaxID=2219224 RepID=UPI00129347DA|nr:ABC transporter permease subunit [Nonomuraea phyllanthi]QFY10538.1 ABC transporter permease subunit [Nonomuraea phyllanthi]